jgi:hypothetical protein
MLNTLYFVPLAFLCAWLALPALRRLLPAPTVIESPGGPVVFFCLAAVCLALVGVTGMLKGAAYTVTVMSLSRTDASTDHVDLAVLAYGFGTFAVVWALARRMRKKS